MEGILETFTTCFLFSWTELDDDQFGSHGNPKWTNRDICVRLITELHRSSFDLGQGWMKSETGQLGMGFGTLERSTAIPVVRMSMI